jgi:hypothetical protein
MCTTNTTYNTNNDKISGSYYKRMINNNNISLFTESLKELTWDSVTIESDPIQCFKKFSEIFSGNYESNFPLKKVSNKKAVNKVKSPWMTKCILKSVRKKINFIKSIYCIQAKKMKTFIKNIKTN